MLEFFLIFFLGFFFFITFGLFNTSFFLGNENSFNLLNLNFPTYVLFFLNLNLISSFYSNGYLIIILLLIFFFLNNIFNIKIIINKKSSLFVLFIFFILSLKLIAEPGLGWDGQEVWFPKVLNFYNNGNFFNLNNVHAAEYPHLGAYIWFIFWKISTLEYEYIGRLFFIFIYIVSIYFLLIKEKISNFILYFLIFLILTLDINLFKGYQEYLIFSLVNIFIIFNYNFFKIKNYHNFFLTILIINAMIWIKNEGIIYSLPIIFLYLKTSKKFTKIDFYFVFTVLILFMLRIYLTNMNTPFSLQGSTFSYDNIFTELINFESFPNDIFLIVKHFLISFFKIPIWLTTIFFLVFPNYKIKRDMINIFRLIFIFCILINFFIFHLTVYDINWHLSVAMDRLLLILSGYFLYFNYLNFKYYLTFTKNSLS